MSQDSLFFLLTAGIDEGRGPAEGSSRIGDFTLIQNFEKSFTKVALEEKF
jgi:hypothetical protein